MSEWIASVAVKLSTKVTTTAKIVIVARMLEVAVHI